MNDQTHPSATVTRFAPSPTGLLHLGHAYSALFAKEAGDRFLLRIEDIDPERCRPDYEEAIYEDLSWLGLDWERQVRRQSDHLDDYAQALEKLTDMGLIYPCFCSRRDIRREIAAAAHAPHAPTEGKIGPVYPGTCRRLSADEQQTRKRADEPYTLRLDMKKAIACAGKDLFWTDLERGEQAATPEIFGDVVLARKDTPTSYHLSVTVDDHLQGITLVTRGEDLAPSTHVHRLLQELLDFDVPTYHHHGLLKGDDGKRFAKRDKSLTLRALRDSGHSPDEVRSMAGL